MRPPPPPFDTTRRRGLALLASSMLLLLLFCPPGACFGWAPSSSSLTSPAGAAGDSRPGAAARAHRRARAVVAMNERTQQPKKVEAYEWAARDVGAPAVILVRPYLDQNIGSCARAMLNFGLTDLRIVKPFCSHLTDPARARSSGADAILENARVFDDLGEAVADLSEVVGTSARQRDMTIRIVSPEQAAGLAVGALRALQAGDGGGKLGFLFGSERNGLTNSELIYASALLQIPTQPAFSSLNLGQAVQIVGYEWFKARARMGDPAALGKGYGYQEEWVGVAKGTRMATVGEVEGLWRRCQELLDAVELNPNPSQRELIYARLQNLLVRAESDVRDVNALHGVLTAIAVKHEKLEPIRQRYLEANKGHGIRRRNGRRVRVVGALGGEDEGEDGEEGDEGDLGLDEGVVRRRPGASDEEIDEERRERETGW